MGAFFIVVSTPILAFLTCVVETHEPVSIQAFRTELLALAQVPKLGFSSLAQSRNREAGQVRAHVGAGAWVGDNNKGQLGVLAAVQRGVQARAEAESCA